MFSLLFRFSYANKSGKFLNHVFQFKRNYTTGPIFNSLVKKWPTTPGLIVPDHIAKPFYATTGEMSSDINGKLPWIHPNDSDIDKIRFACQLVKHSLDLVECTIERGMTTNEIDCLVHEFLLSNNAYPSPLNYGNFPKSICTSINDVACHGIPDNRPLLKGDIINVDISAFLNGVHGDASRTYLIGKSQKHLIKLERTTRECVYKAIEICKPGQPLQIIAKAIEEHAANNGFVVSPLFYGHGIGREFHCSPSIVHVHNNDETLMEPGMIFTIEPILLERDGEAILWEDGWTVQYPGIYSAQHEETVLITENGVEVLTA